eukprot:GILK01006306.1.p1 GENE.GILK01006306.1~~GILK01006306.1.p1  ORF type:complete len:297 (+),score=34.84 GILK01006306.1:50-892(+)
MASLSSTDEGVRRQAWIGAIPVVFSLSINDISSLEAPAPFYCMVPRGSYLPLLLPDIKQHFASFGLIGSAEDDIWFDYEGIPLRWHLPTGVLFDVHGGNQSALPWKITLHFRGFPAGDILKVQRVDAIRSHFINSIKEATYLRVGSTRSIMNLSKADQTQLWDAVMRNHYDLYWSIGRALFDIAVESTKLLPVRIHFASANPTFLQQPVPPMDEQGKPQTLGGALRNLLPSLFSSETIPQVFVQGLTPSMDTPLYWLVGHMSSPDSFLHVCIMAETPTDI